MGEAPPDLAALVEAASSAQTIAEVGTALLPALCAEMGASAAAIARPGRDAAVVLAASDGVDEWGDLDGLQPVPLGSSELFAVFRPADVAGPSGLVWALLKGAVERIAATEALADLQARFDNAQAIAHMGDYDWHIPTDTNRWSDELFRIYGCEPQSFNASYDRFLGFIHPDDREKIQGVHQEAYATGEPYQMVERIVRPTGEVRVLESNGQVIFGENGPVRMRGTCVDITARWRAEQEVRTALGQVEAVLAAAPEAVVVIDAGGRVLRANPQAAGILGVDLDPGAILHDVLPDLLSPAAIEQILDGGDAAVQRSGLDVVVGRSANGELHLDLSIGVLRSDDAEPAIALYLRDAAPRLEAERDAMHRREEEVLVAEALELNDNVIQGLTSMVYCLDTNRYDRAREFLEHTLESARLQMQKMLEQARPANIQPGDLVRGSDSSLSPRPSLDGPPLSLDRPAAVTPGDQTVVLVDDAADQRALFRMILNQVEGFHVVAEAENGRDAIDVVAEHRPDLVLLDLAMPVMDGLEALPLIRERCPESAVVVVSGFDEGQVGRAVHELGALDYITKGTSLPVLLERVRAVLRRVRRAG